MMNWSENFNWMPKLKQKANAIHLRICQLFFSTEYIHIFLSAQESTKFIGIQIKFFHYVLLVQRFVEEWQAKAGKTDSSTVCERLADKKLAAASFADSIPSSSLWQKLSII